MLSEKDFKRLSENEEQNKEDFYNPLKRAYFLIHGEEPSSDIDDVELANKIIEVLDNPNYVPRELAIKCVNYIMNMRYKYKVPANSEERNTRDEEIINLILYLEQGIVQNIYPELKHIDEVHMEDIEVAYRRYLQEKKDNNTAE